MSSPHWNQDKFNTTLRQYLVASSLTFPQAMNKKGYDLTLATSKETKMVEKQAILDAVGPTGSRVVSQKVRFLKGRLDKKTGLRMGASVKRGKAVSEDTFTDLAIALAIKRLGPRVHAPDAWQQILKMATTIYKARLRSRGFVKQGWIPAKEILKRSDRGGDFSTAFEDSDIARLGKRGAAVRAGGADSAQRGFKPSLKIWNAVPAAKHANAGAFTLGGAALDRAFARVTADMENYLDRKMGKDAAAFNRAQR